MMPWQLKLVDRTTFADRRRQLQEMSNEERLKHYQELIGMCWFASDEDQQRMMAGTGHKKASAHYRRDWAGKRNILTICLPSNPDFIGYSTWSPDCTESDGGGGWRVTGEPPNITCHPSINAIDSYHGWVKNGQLTDDCEGRKYPTPENPLDYLDDDK